MVVHLDDIGYEFKHLVEDVKPIVSLVKRVKTTVLDSGFVGAQRSNKKGAPQPKGQLGVKRDPAPEGEGHDAAVALAALQEATEKAAAVDLLAAINATALLHLARETIPSMLEAGKGTILVTGNTSATRGKANWGFFASTKAAQRILAEAIAREFGPQGIHVAYFIIDASIDTPRTRPLMAADKSDDFFAKPSAIAEEMYKTAHQDRSTWSFRVKLRPFGEVW